jgi:hypothetical protein
VVLVKKAPDYTVIWRPQPGPQTALIECPVEEVFYGGARGGGKTEGSIGDWLSHSSKYGEYAIGLFVRRTRKQLEEVVARTQQIFPKIGGRFNTQLSTWTMKSGARLKFAYLEHDRDAEEYQGHSYTRIYVEEVTNFPSPGPIMKLKATLRPPAAARVPVGMRLTGNPGGPGHHWVRRRYIDPAPLGYKIIEERYHDTLLDMEVVRQRTFIPSKVTDNKLLLQNDPMYVARLRQSGSEQLVRAWLEGDWGVIDGAYFTEFDYNRHVLPNSGLPRIPEDATRIRAFDWGYAKPFSVGWYAISDGTWGLPKGFALKYREWYGTKGDNNGLRLETDQVAAGILEKEKGEKIVDWVADPAIFIHQSGPSIAETFRKAGVRWRPADNKRIPGWAMLRHRLKGEDDQAMIGFVESCEHTIRTLPLLQHDEHKPEDVDTESEDHAGDETRYFAMSRPWLPSAARVEPVFDPSRPDMPTFNQLLNELKRKHAREREPYAYG